MNQKALQRQWSTINRRRGTFRKKFRPVIGDALDEHVEQMFEIIDRTSDINMVPQRIQEKQLQSDMIKKAFSDLFQTVGMEFFRYDRRQAKKRAGVEYQIKESEDEIAEGIIAQEIQKWAQDNVGQKIVSVSGTSKDIVIRRLEELIPEILEQGIGGGEAQTMLRDNIENEWLRFKRYRTERIIRTEVTPASTLGSMKGVESTGIPHNKIWVAAFDETRDWHAAASGQKVDMKDSFLVMGERMIGPGRPETSASAENVINCNCFLNFETQ